MTLPHRLWHFCSKKSNFIRGNTKKYHKICMAVAQKKCRQWKQTKKRRTLLKTGSESGDLRVNQNQGSSAKCLLGVFMMPKKRLSKLSFSVYDDFVIFCSRCYIFYALHFCISIFFPSSRTSGNNDRLLMSSRSRVL